MLSLSRFMLAAMVLVLLQPLSMLRSIGRSQVRRFAKGCRPACLPVRLFGRTKQGRKKKGKTFHTAKPETHASFYAVHLLLPL
uniref:Secreted peptide n=1 Tax=Anopheles braziliensis TaxID=58242 RepID=A0A2M3ZM64_9DIPT